MTEPLDSRRLRAFQVLARTGSFTQTAHELRLTQSCISHAMKALEGEIGCRLLDRLGKKLALTQAGEQLLKHTEKILAEMQTARETLAQMGKWGKGRLRLGATTTACQLILPSVLREFKESFPDYTITLEPGETRTLARALLDQRTDLSLSLAANEAQLDFQPLFTDELYFVVPPQHPWVSAGTAEPSQIPDQNFVTFNKHGATFSLIEDYFRHDKLVVKQITEVGSLEAAKELVKLGLGLAVLAPWTVRKETKEGSLVAVPLGRRKLERHWGIHHRQGRQLTLAEETFVGLCQSATAHLSAPNEDR